MGKVRITLEGIEEMGLENIEEIIRHCKGISNSPGKMDHEFTRPTHILVKAEEIPGLREKEARNYEVTYVNLKNNESKVITITRAEAYHFT